VDGVVGLRRDRREGEARGGLRHRGCAFQKAGSHDGSAGPKGQNTTQETAARDRAFDHAVEFLNFGAGKFQLVPFVGGQAVNVDIFHRFCFLG
jgi:hypothetical protein